MRGDDLMGSDLIDYMKAKSDKLLEKDENKQKIAAIKKELYQKKGTLVSIQQWKRNAVRTKVEEMKMRKIHQKKHSSPATTVP